MPAAPGRPWSTCFAAAAALKASRFRIVAAVDQDPTACASYRANHRSVRLYEQDIRTVDPVAIRRDHLGGRDLDVLVVCSPCQPFSSQNRAAAVDDRVDLILTAIPFAAALGPRVILFENVPGLTRERFAPVILALKAGLESLGYVLSAPHRVDAADYDVPQRRVRCVLLARRGAPPPPFPAATTPAGRRVTVRHAIKGLPALGAGRASSADALHYARAHSPVVVERLTYIPHDGGSRDALPERLRLDCHREHRGHPDVYGRMAWDEVAPTLTTGCTDVTRGRFAHPTARRAITLREAARLQTFPDAYHFVGGPNEVARQIGNAVPVAFVRALAPTLRAAPRPAARVAAGEAVAP